jgi:UDPglucose--hexose-1-phosphate uridylyltransferase
MRNPQYGGTFVFENDFAALRLETPQGGVNDAHLIVAEAEAGVCRVICFSPGHDLTVARMSIAQLREVVDTWTEQYCELGNLPAINWVQIFENRGTMMGASNPHPHGQIWANQTVPNEARKESMAQAEFHAKHDCCLLCAYLSAELKSGERLICDNESFQALVPFWAVWPFEVMIVSKGHRTGLDLLDPKERGGLAEILKQVTMRYDNLFRIPFPYTMGFHQRPTDGLLHPEWHFHAHFYPPLLRSATVRKFMVGYEMLAMPQRDISPELAATRLREAGSSLGNENKRKPDA